MRRSLIFDHIFLDVYSTLYGGFRALSNREIRCSIVQIFIDLYVFAVINPKGAKEIFSEY